MKVRQYTYILSIGESKIFAVYKISLNHFPSVIINRLLLGNFFWREGLEAAFGAGKQGERGQLTLEAIWPDGKSLTLNDVKPGTIEVLWD